MCKPLPGDEICELCLDYSLAHCEECEYRERMKEMTDMQKAILGDKEAARRLTNAGVLLPCPLCGKRVAHSGTIAEHECTDEDDPNYLLNLTQYDVICKFSNGGCGATSGVRQSEYEAMLAWNTRPPEGGEDA